MYISHFEIRNSKSFREPEALEFKPGFNIITGQNSAGKTALLEALTLQFEPNPHRSAITIPVEGVPPPAASSVRITFAISREELLGILSGADHHFAAPRRGFTVPGYGVYQGSNSPQEADAFLAWLFEHPEFQVSVRVNKEPGREIWVADEPHLGLYPAEPLQGNVRLHIQVRVDPERGPITLNPPFVNTDDDVSLRLANVLRSRIYRFSAERFSVGQCGFGPNPILAADAHNLPEVINVLKANTNRFLQLNELVREILPQVKHVSVRAFSSTQVQIIVWPHDPGTTREDLAVPLNQCGSGVGQVLAILYVIMTAVHPQAIIVDEPQSFLHPGAVRKLIEVLKRYPRHQYIFATHSPTVVMASDPATLTMTRLTGVETSFQKINPSDSKELESYLAEIGARLSDVFGADNILWVEGQTEEQCFPRILKGIAHKSLMGTAIVGIRQTGDLEGRDATRVLELYRRISQSSTLLPPAVAFILDRECRTAQQLTELRRISSNLAFFLPRRMYESYLLCPEAIAAVANEVDGFRQERITVEEVRGLIDQKRQEIRYYCPGTTEVPVDWIRDIDAAGILQEVFEELSETRVAYVKSKHSVQITEWLIAYAPDELNELSDTLVRLLPPQ
ncbi:MAG: ATP-dependent endonuclease [Terriglobales bacterium]